MRDNFQSHGEIESTYEFEFDGVYIMQTLKQKSFTTTSLLLIFVLCFLLVIIRWINIFNEDVYVISVAINSHITNFTLSLMMCTLIGYLLLLAGKKYVYTIMVGIPLIVLNFIYEIFLPVLNTTDIIDALYGLVGVVISLMYLYFIDKYGFIRE